MSLLFNKFVPIILIFFFGVMLKGVRIFSRKDGGLFLRLVFYFTLPALILSSVIDAELNVEYITLPFIPILVIFLIYLVSYQVVKRFKVNLPTRGTYLIGSLIINTGFCLPFIVSVFGSEGITIYTIYDFGNTFLIMTFVYYLAIKHGSNHDGKVEISKFLKLPPLWALITGIILNLGNVGMPTTIDSFLSLAGSPTVPLVMLSLGIFFSPSLKNLSRTFTVIMIRSGLGLILGILIVEILGFSGMLRTIVIICCGAPVGYNTLVFCSLENLNSELAANLISYSILTGLIYVPLLLIYL